MSKNNITPHFSIIIPLEFHRGQIENCLRAWTQEQTYARDGYEILAAGCRSSLSEDSIELVRGLLGEQDRLLLYDDPHDISLCFYAAYEAKGEILIFTESHCLPKPDVLSMSEERMREHPEWAGFSGNSLPITHNRLSIVEAEMYDVDIKYGMTKHPWRKILDQFFAVRSREYFDAGGFNPDLGHFSEWHLAARMHQKEYHIGYATDIQFWHYYIGDYGEVIEFCKDFAQGEMKFVSELKNDPCRSYFHEPIEWTRRLEWVQGRLNGNFLNKVRVLIKSLRNLSAPYNVYEIIKILVVKGSRPFIGIWPEYLHAHLRFQIAVLILRLNLLFRTRKTQLQSAFLYLIYTTVRLERIRFVRHWIKEKSRTGQFDLQKV